MGDSVVVPPDYEALVDAYLTLRLAPTDGVGECPPTITGEWRWSDDASIP